MTRRPHEPLSAEEQALAAGLPRLAGRSAPSAELDAQILALARAPAAAPSPRRPRRWQVPAALAATLCLAAGIAWQLRTAPTRHAQMDNARPVAVAAEPALHAPARSMVPDAMIAPPPLAGTAQQSAARSPAPAVSPQASRTDRAHTEGTAAPPAGDTEAAPPTAAPAAATAQSLPVPPPAPPAAAPVPMVSAFPEQAPAPAAERSAPRAQEALSRERAVPSEPTPPKTLAPPAARAVDRPLAAPPARIQTHSAASGSARSSASTSEAADDDMPPATMNSPSTRAAWLRRIAELAQAGQHEEARASLAEFRRRYPNERIPDALKALESPAEP